jgi:hypothetical protein
MRTIRCVLLALTLATRTVHADPPAPDEALAREADEAAASGQRARAAELRTALLARLGDSSTPLALTTLRALADDHERLHDLPRALTLHLDYARRETAPAPAAEALTRALALASALGDTAATHEALDRLTALARDTPALRDTAAEQVLACVEPLAPRALDAAAFVPSPQDARAALALLEGHRSLFTSQARLDLRLRASVLRGRALRALGDEAGAWQAFRAAVQAWRAAHPDEALHEPWLDGQDPQTGIRRMEESERREAERQARQSRRHGGIPSPFGPLPPERPTVEPETPVAQAAREAAAEARFALAMAIVPHAVRPIPRSYEGPRTRRDYDRWMERVWRPAFVAQRAYVEGLAQQQFIAVMGTHVPVWSMAAGVQLARFFLDLDGALHSRGILPPDLPEDYAFWQHPCYDRPHFLRTARTGLVACVQHATTHPEAAPLGAECAHTLHALAPREFPDEGLIPPLRQPVRFARR